MFFLLKCYKRLEQESSLLKKNSWFKAKFTNLNDFSLFTKKKKKKNFFLIFLKLTIFRNIILYQFSPTVFVIA